MSSSIFESFDLRRGRQRAVISGLIAFLLVSDVRVEAAQVRNLGQAQQRIRARMIKEQGGNRPRVSFNNDGKLHSDAGNVTRATGTGVYYRNGGDRGRSFNYDAIFRTDQGDLRKLQYNFTGQAGGRY